MVPTAMCVVKFAMSPALARRHIRQMPDQIRAEFDRERRANPVELA
jgi:hypothetical protein